MANRILFKAESACYLHMVKLHLQNSLLKRFGSFRQMECRILKNPSVKPLLTRWAQWILNIHISTEKQVNLWPIPSDVLNHPEVHKLQKTDPEIAWLIRMIQKPSDSDCVPIPTFPSTLLCSHPQWPYNSRQHEKLQDTYGLLKWPYNQKAATWNHDVNDFLNSRITPEQQAKLDVSTPVKKPSSLHSTITTGYTASHIYAPSEMETGYFPEY